MMKFNALNRAATLVLLLFMVANLNMLRAQQPTHAHAPQPADTIEGSSDDLSFTQDIAMSGNATWNRLLGRQVYERATSNIFCELGLICGTNDVATGLQVAYVPQSFGTYATYMRGIYYHWVMAGAVWRPITEPINFDFQIYCGAVAGDGAGINYGIRVANANPNTAFSWFSSSLGAVHTSHGSYFTIGLSLGIVALSGLVIAL